MLRATLSCILPLAAALGIANAALADGCVLRKKGGYLRETHQHAYITWSDGIERLWLSTRTEATDEASLWIVPIPGRPIDVKAEPTEHIPNVEKYRGIIDAARLSLGESRILALMLDTGLFPCCPLGMGAKDSKSTASQASNEVVEHQRVEKLGMVVTVVTAKTTAALDDYFRANEVNTTAAQLTSFGPYFKDEYVLICAWAAQAKKKTEARGLRIEFATPEVYYPLRPSRVYTEEIPTAIYVQGQWQPPALKDLAYQYVFGTVEIDAGAGGDWEGKLHNVTLTRIEMGGRPSDWNEDLHLQPGAPAQIPVARSLVIYPWGFGTRVLLGAILALWLPLVVIPRGERKVWDWLWAAGAGASIAGSIYLSIIVFVLWCGGRKLLKGDTAAGGEFVRGLAIVGPSLLGMAILGALLVAEGPRDLLHVGPFVVPSALLLVAMGGVGCVYTGRRVLLLIPFAIAHLAVFLGLIWLADRWLALAA